MSRSDAPPLRCRRALGPRARRWQLRGGHAEHGCAGARGHRVRHRGPSRDERLRLPTGLRHVATLALDADGRLWAGTAAFKDVGQDAVFLIARAGATPKKVINGVHTPLGLLWRKDTLYVSSHERVDAYSGFNGDSFRDAANHRRPSPRRRREQWPHPVARGPHPVGHLGPLRRMPAASRYSAAVVSFRPDGRDLRVEARGIRAPIGLAYVPGTSDLLVTMNQRDDLGAKTPGDWLSLVRPGQAWGFPTCYGQAGSAYADVPQPTAVLDKHAAVSGLAILSGQLGASMGTSAIVAEYTLGKVQRVALAKSGSRYTGHVEPFLTGFKNPVPVLLTHRNTLLVGDWGSGSIYQVGRA